MVGDINQLADKLDWNGGNVKMEKAIVFSPCFKKKIAKEFARSSFNEQKEMHSWRKRTKDQSQIGVDQRKTLQKVPRYDKIISTKTHARG